MPIYVDPVGLQEAEKTMRSPVAIALEGFPCGSRFRRRLINWRSTHRVKDDLLHISSPNGVKKELTTRTEPFNDSLPRSIALVVRLDQRISMSFANDTPMEDVLKYIKSVTQGPNDSGIPIYVVPKGLRLAE